VSNEIIRLPVSGDQNCQAKLLSLVEELECSGKIEPGAVTEAWVAHDRWCAVYHGHPCNCNPAIEISVRQIGFQRGAGADVRRRQE